MLPLLLSLLTGVTVGLRSMTAPALVCWAARLGRLNLENTWLEFLGSAPAAYILTVFAIAELVADKLPKTPSRKTAPGIIARVAGGALCGAALDAGGIAGLLAGAAGGVAGTFLGYEFRMRLARALGGKDLAAALTEDAVAVGGAALIVFVFSQSL